MFMNSSRFILLILAFSLIATGSLNAQDNPEIDSLITLMEAATGEDRFQRLIDLSANSSLTAQDRLNYAEDAISLATELSNPELLADAHIQHGFIQYEFDDNDGALNSFESAYSISEEAGYPEGMAMALLRKGRVYVYVGDPRTAEDHYLQAREIAKKNRIPLHEARALYFLGDLKKRTADYSEALEYYEQAGLIAMEVNELEMMADILGDEGLIMYLQGDFTQATSKYEEAAEYFNRIGARFDAARMYLRIGNANLERAEYDVALIYLQKALPIFEEFNSKSGIFAVTNSMGVIYAQQEVYDRALEMYLNGLEISREQGAQAEVARSLLNIGNVYNALAADSLRSIFGDDFQDSIKIENTDKYLILFNEALQYYNESMEVWEEIGDIAGIVDCMTNLGIIYIRSGKPAMALEPLESALELNEEQLHDRAIQANIYLWLGEVYLIFDNYNTALEYLNEAVDLANEIDTKQEVLYGYRILSDLHEKRGDYVQALQYHKLYFAMHDTLNQEDRRQAIADMQVKYETEATEKENALLLAESELQEAKISRTRTVLVITIIAIGIFIVMMLQLIRQNNLKKKANRELALKNDLITEQKKEITDSIMYASRIQSAMLPPGDYLDRLMPERFIIYMPRDIVSGDYYYITEKDGKIICVAADCTGHGVPGAFMSLLGIAFLNEIMSKHTELHTDEILQELRSHVITALHQTGKEGESQDGMDLALYILDPKTKKIEFSGANNSLLIFRNGEMIEAKADKMPIGIHTRFQERFTRHNLDLQKGDMIYTFSDGYPDQFGGPSQKKFMIKKFKNMLQEIHMKSMTEQKKIMEKTLSDWMAGTAQIDDILVIGMRI
jgi:serine phosphatase RsbU (regulator of sigma subunit)/Tfp pilus assembly protein PilF